MKKFEKVEKTVFLGVILRLSNLNVLHKGVLMQDWVFRLGVYRLVVEERTSISKWFYVQFTVVGVSQINVKIIDTILTSQVSINLVGWNKWGGRKRPNLLLQ